jgi:DNA primase
MIMDIREAVLIDEMNKILRKKVKKETEEPPAQEESGAEGAPVAEPQLDMDPEAADNQEKEIIRVLLLYGNEVIMIRPDQLQEEVPVRIGDYVTHQISSDDYGFEHTGYGTIFGKYRDLLEQSDVVDGNFFLNNPERDISLTAVEVVFSPYQLSHNWKERSIMVTTERERLDMLASTTIWAYQVRKMSKQIILLSKQMLPELHLPDDEQRMIQMQVNDLMKKRAALDKKLGRVVPR